MKRRSSPCPCLSRTNYEKCCGIYHRGQAAPTPLALMRSRFAAYAKGRASYIIETTDPLGDHFDEDKERWRTKILNFSRNTRFLGLEILGSSIEAKGDHGWVHFRANLSQLGNDASFTEYSHFRKEGNQWLYAGGEIED